MLETGKDKVLEAIKIINKDENVLYAGPNYLWKLSSQSSASDTYMGNFYNQWACTQIQLSEAITYVDSNKTDNNSIVVAVIDSGIEGDHEALESNIDIDKSKQFFDSDEDPLTDDYGHGTKVAGIIKGVANNYVNFRSYRVSKSYTALSSDVYMAIREAYLENVPIINLSMEWSTAEGVATSTNYDQVLLNIMDMYQGLIVCAAGNNGAGDVADGGTDIDTDTNYDYYPSQYELSNVIVVGASTEKDGIEFHSNYGAKSVDVFAPGEKLYTTTTTGYTANEKWTSMATPFVTGLAILLKKINANLEPEHIIHIIKSTVDTDDTTNGVNGDDIGDLWGECTSNGRINAYKAVQMAKNYDFTVLCPHSNLIYTSNDKSTHTYRCSECSYTSTEAHDLYIYSRNTNMRTVKCIFCIFSVTCTDELEYDGAYPNGHYVHCLVSSCFALFEPHNPISYVQTSSVNTHNALCSECGEYYPDYHNWVAIIGGYRCTLCFMTSAIIPGEIQNLSDEELELLLAGLTDEELAELTLALNEDDRGRIAALLPEREDDLVTE